MVNPAFGGAAIWLPGAPVALLLDAVSSRASAALPARIRAGEDAPRLVEQRYAIIEVREGLSWE